MRRPGGSGRTFLESRPRRWAIGGAALALVAVAPWFVPWPTSNPVASDDPSSMINRAVQEANGPGPVREVAPTKQNVTAVNKAVAALAVSGYDSPVTAKELTSVSTRPGPYRVLGRIQIPRVGLDVTFGEGVSDDSLLHGPGHWPGTPLPGRAGNAVISGHRNTHTQPFKYLNLLQPGDKIITRVGDQGTVTYRVTKTTIVPQSKYKDFVLKQPADDNSRQITLFACHPEGDPIFRIVVQGTADHS